MTLLSGSRLGPYEIAGAIGAGGMGEVFRARDTKLGRDVAIKVLPDEFARDEGRVARFKREAQILASLSHPNIAAIYGLEEGDGVLALAMEYVAGEDLGQRLTRGAIPIDESLAFAKQIAEALEEAHERGVVHRDLKPANVKVTPDGRVKVLDFGLAKAIEGDTAASSGSHELTHSPTMTRHGTEAGIILGTAAYMSPEQARGRTVDKRADIWSFGVLLFEMLAGKRLFEGETVSDVLAAVLRADVEWAALPASVPAELRRLIARCLERDPKNRLHDIADARISIDEALRGDARSVPGPAAPALPRPAVLPWAVAALALIAGIGLGLRRGSTPVASRPLSAFGVLLPEQHVLTSSQSPLVEIAADGRTILFTAAGEKSVSLFRRPLDRLAPTRVEGADGAENPLISPDGRSIAFFAEGMLRKVPAEGGAPVGVADALAPRGASFSRDGSLVFSPLYNSPLFRVAATGGPPVAVTKLDTAKGERSHRWPQVLPDGRSVIFTVGLASSPGDYDGGTIDALRLDTGERRTLLRGARMARYTALGYLVYQRKSTLLAQRFDAPRLETVGEPFAIQEGVGGDSSSGAGYFGVSDGGLVAFVPEGSIPKERVLALVDAAGHETTLRVPAASFNHPRFSPDGRRLAVSIGGGSAADDDVYVVDLATERMQRLTFGPGYGAPMWTPDGRRILFTNGRSGETGLVAKAADGSGEPVIVHKSPEQILADAWLPDGRRLMATSTALSIDVFVVDTAGGDKVQPLLANPAAGEYGAALSPDGRYVAYTTTETGTDEVVVETFPPGRGKWQVSSSGGMTPVWSRDGRKLYFAAGHTMMAVDVSLEGVLRLGTPRALFTGPYVLRTVPQRNYDLGPDGRFVFVRRELLPAKPGQIVVLDGWNAADPSRAAAVR